ncbi:MAG: diacylglycerol kinase family lipid kinase [Saprospiraceae bacterium]
MSKLNSKWFVLVNPASGGGKISKLWPEVANRFLEKGIQYEVFYTQKKSHGIELTQQGITSGFRNFIAVGGDGTLNEMLNGFFLQNQIPQSELTLTALPLGTGNDWVKTWSIPKDLDTWFEMFGNRKIVTQDVGMVRFKNGNKEGIRYFMNVAGLAYDAFVVEYAEQRKPKKWGKVFFLFMVLKCLFKYKYPEVSIYYDDQSYKGKIYTINIGICNFSGGGMEIVPHANPQDGKFALTFVKPISKLGVLLNTYRFYNGSIGNHPKVSTSTVEEIQVDGVRTTVKLEVDGELIGACPSNFTILKNALNILVP